jgi:hypothetical protein
MVYFDQQHGTSTQVAALSDTRSMRADKRTMHGLCLYIR